MSETFYIKKTAFDDNNFDLITREEDSFIIGPGELNGPGGIEPRASDLELYGFGSLKWGEGVDQNQYRLMESSACPAKVTGDFLVGTDVADGFEPGTGSFNTGTDPITPKDERDLGIGNGITEPLIGQIWYNTFDKILYNYELTGWVTVFQEASTALTTHIDDHTVHLRDGQNEFLDGLILGGSPLSLQSDDVNELIGMGSTQGITTVQGQLDLMVELAGDTMTGNLIVGDGATADAVTVRAAGGNAHYWLRRSDDTNAGIFYANISGDDIRIQKYSLVGAPTATLILDDTGNVSINGGANIPTLSEHLTRRDFITTNYAPLASPPLTGNPTAPTQATSDDSTRIATTAWVKNQTSSSGNVITSGSSSSVSVPTGITRVEVTIVGGGGGGAQGSDGGSFTAVNNAVNGTASVITIPGIGSRSAGGGEHGIPSEWVDSFPHLTHGRTNGGFGMSSRGGRGDPGATSRGGDGGGSELGYGGTGGSASSAVNNGQAGWQGGGGGGGSGQDNGGGNGGDSGHLYRQVASVSAGQVISWTLGAGGNGGSGSGRGNGGKGGNGYIIIRWSN